MANILTSQILEDGPRNALVNVVAVLDTGNLTASDIVDPANFNPVPAQFRIDCIYYSIADQLEAQILWDATVDVIAQALAGRGKVGAWRGGGLQNNAGAGKTGKIQLTTTGWASGVQNLSLLLYLVKQGGAAG